MMVYLFLAPGFEEVEALTPLDYLRRCGVDVRTVGIGAKTVTGSHGITVLCDLSEEEVDLALVEAIVLPGGLPGTTNLEKNVTVQTAVRYAYEHDLPIGAICAAPSILGHLHMLDGRTATSFPNFSGELGKAEYTAAPVETDGNIITARGAGVSQQFAFALVEKLVSAERAEELRKSVQWA